MEALASTYNFNLDHVHEFIHGESSDDDFQDEEEWDESGVPHCQWSLWAPERRMEIIML